ncbi:MAG: hypothetical protein M1374_06525 [Firmicutes bacterium]|nr:hypothetical protein [Bacillota bacterium]
MSQRTVFICNPLDSALVCGSSQDITKLFTNGVPGVFRLVKRKSGGGVVLVAPLCQVWIDVFIPCEDPLYESDILKSPLWLGEIYRKVLSSFGVEGRIYEGRLVGEYAKLICFAGLGPGEVMASGTKMVGISQRRIKSGVWFYTMLPLGNSQEYLWDIFGEEKIANRLDLSQESTLKCENTINSWVGGLGRTGGTTIFSAKDKWDIEKTFLEVFALL